MNLRILSWLSRTWILSVVFSVLLLAHLTDRAATDAPDQRANAASRHHRTVSASVAQAQAPVTVSR